MLVVAPFFLLGLGAVPFDDPGEGMHAEIARELAVSGDPLRLTLNGVRYVDKPPLLYALLAAAFAAGGPGEGPARLVSAVAALAAVAATAWLGARLLGARCGFVAGIALGTSCGFFVYGRYVRPETLFVAALAGGFALLLTGVIEERRGLAVLGLAAFGAAGLAKDPLGALLPPLAVALSLAACGCARPLRRWLPPAGVTALLVLGLGWYVAVSLATPGFAWYTVIDNHVLNVARARHFPDEDVPLTAIEFLAVGSVGALPWLLPAAAVVWRLARARAWRDPAEAGWTALAAWALGVFALTTASGFRLPHYGLPAYPAVALLAARGFAELDARRLASLHAALFGVFSLVCGVGWLHGAPALRGVLDATDVATRKAVSTGGATLDGGPFVPLLAAGALAFAAGALALLVIARRRGSRAATTMAVIATLLLVLPAMSAGLGASARGRAVRDLAVDLRARVAPGDLVVHEGALENSGALEWYSGVRPTIVDGRRSVLAFGATRADGAAAFWDRERLLEAWTGAARVWLVTGRAPTVSVVASLPRARLVASAGGRRLYVNR
ncbi:MAG TPA: glycosyltransferase family 39 protein [Methylomirabilota bacterium]|nr:glycosyltransferase family 39 protein [Methylomirabilota bacterium]